jgi:hypothetical protein
VATRRFRRARTETIDGSALDLPFEQRTDCAGDIFTPNPVIHVGVNNLISI